MEVLKEQYDRMYQAELKIANLKGKLEAYKILYDCYKDSKLEYLQKECEIFKLKIDLLESILEEHK